MKIWARLPLWIHTAGYYHPQDPANTRPMSVPNTELRTWGLPKSPKYARLAQNPVLSPSTPCVSLTAPHFGEQADSEAHMPALRWIMMWNFLLWLPPCQDGDRLDLKGRASACAFFGYKTKTTTGIMIVISVSILSKILLNLITSLCRYPILTAMPSSFYHNCPHFTAVCSRPDQFLTFPRSELTKVEAADSSTSYKL